MFLSANILFSLHRVTAAVQSVPVTVTPLSWTAAAISSPHSAQRPVFSGQDNE